MTSAIVSLVVSVFGFSFAYWSLQQLINIAIIFMGLFLVLSAISLGFDMWFKVWKEKRRHQ